MATIATSTKLMAIDYNKQKYFNTSIAEVERCTVKPGNLHSCVTTSVHDLDKDDNCMLNQILNRKDYWTCRVSQFTVTKPLWIQLTMENSWLILTVEPFRIAVHCHGIREEPTINATAIIRIKSGCTIKTEHTNILSRQKDILKVKGTYHKAVQISTSAGNVQTHTKEMIGQRISPIIKLEQPVLPRIEEENNYQHKWHPVERHSTTIIVALLLLSGLMVAWACGGRLWTLIVTTCCKGRTKEASKAEEGETIQRQPQFDTQQATTGTRTWTVAE
jgi:hypothetical protein